MVVMFLQLNCIYKAMFLDNGQKNDSEFSSRKWCLCYWLFLDGARWSNKKLSFKESKSKQLYYRMPIIHIMISIKREYLKYDTVYLCSMYKKAEKKGTLSTTGQPTNFVIALSIPKIKQPEHWIIREVVLLCQLSVNTINP